MELIVLKNNLKEGLGIMGRVGSDNNTLPVLKNFLIETEDGKIKVSSTNLELAITSYIPAKIVKSGSVTVPTNITLSIINNLQNERITLETKQNNLTVKTENYEAKVQGTSKEEFPIIPTIVNKKEFIEIESDVLKEGFLSVISAAQTTNLRPELNGISFDYQVGLIKLAATDSFRLAEKTITDNQFKSNIEKKFKNIIPQKTIQELIRILSEKSEEKIKIIFDKNQILFKTEKFEIISRLINGDFPDYQSIIPDKITTEISVNKNELINALKLTGSFSDRLNEIKIIIKNEAKNIEIYSSNPILGENQYLISAKTNGHPMEIVFNWRFLFDGIKNIELENIFLGLNSDNKPAVIKSPTNQDYLYVLMPIKSE